MRSLAYEQFLHHTSDIKLPVVKVLEARKLELWELVKHQRDSTEIARLQGKMDEIDELIKQMMKK